MNNPENLSSYYQLLVEQGLCDYFNNNTGFLLNYKQKLNKIDF
jgi:hypothetical protein